MSDMDSFETILYTIYRVYKVGGASICFFLKQKKFYGCRPAAAAFLTLH